MTRIGDDSTDYRKLKMFTFLSQRLAGGHALYKEVQLGVRREWQWSEAPQRVCVASDRRWCVTTSGRMSLHLPGIELLQPTPSPSAAACLSSNVSWTPNQSYCCLCIVLMEATGWISPGNGRERKDTPKKDIGRCYKGGG